MNEKCENLSPLSKRLIGFKKKKKKREKEDVKNEACHCHRHRNRRELNEERKTKYNYISTKKAHRTPYRINHW